MHEFWAWTGAALLALAPVATPLPAAAAEPFLSRIHHFHTLASTVPANGDQNPYAVVVSPVSAGALRQGDVLVTNFNNQGNLQGLGTTIVDYRPATGAMSVFATLPRHLAQCPGGVGLTTALAVLRAGWVVVGSLPSEDGTTATKGAGCLLVLDAQGRLAGTLAGPDIDGPWGNMALVDHGDSATLFVSNTGFGVKAPGQDEVDQASVLRLDLRIPPGGVPQVSGRTVVAGFFGEQADKDSFIVGPTGLALGPDGTLYVSDALGNRITAIWDATTRDHTAGIGRVVTQDGLLNRPLALAWAPNGHLLAVNGQNGQCVEIDPATGKQVQAVWLDANRAQTPPGSGDLFGLAVTPAGDGLYFVKDETNTLVLAQ